MLEKTFAIIKPDAIQSRNSGNVIAIIEKNGFDILRMQKIQLTKNQAERFYDIHKERPFFSGLVEMMSSKPVILMVLQKENAVVAWKSLMGVTNPAEAAPGTIRKLYGIDLDHNVVHGSDSPENAVLEIEQFFPELVK